MRRDLVALLLVALAAFAAACGGGGAKPAEPGRRPASTAKLKILEPTPGAVVGASSVPVRIELMGARVLLEASRNVTSDTGHLHLKLDGKTLTLLAGLEVDLVDLTGGPIARGPHVLEAEFAAADHGPFDPRVVSTVTFTVR